MKKRIFEIVEVAEQNDRLSRLYDLFMIIVIIASIIPLTLKNTNELTNIIDKICVIVFTIDYLIRFYTADLKYKDNKKIIAFIRYLFSPMSIIYLLSILPSIVQINQGFKLLRLLRLTESFRVFKAFRYSKSLSIVKKVIRDSKNSLIAVCTLTVAYILISALLIFSTEPDTFNTFFDAVYWATTSLATIGYGDIYPITVVGKIITMISSIFGIAIIALPSGIITAGYMKEIDNKNRS